MERMDGDMVHECLNHGRRYIQESLPFLTQALGRDPRVEEFAVFIVGAIGGLFGAGYEVIKADNSEAAAKGWIPIVGQEMSMILQEHSQVPISINIVVKEEVPP